MPWLVPDELLEAVSELDAPEFELPLMLVFPALGPEVGEGAIPA